MIQIRQPEDIFQAHGKIQNGTFHGRWHFSFGDYYDPENMHFGTLRVFNDDTLSPGAVWPLHYHSKNEVVTYCVEGEFRHADQTGKGGILKKGWVQHTTIGTGMYHSEINNNPNESMRFVQMWFFPEQFGLKPAVEQKKVDKLERTNKLFPLVSNEHPDALPIRSEAIVLSLFLEANHNIKVELQKNWGIYLYVLEGGPVLVNNYLVRTLGAAKLQKEDQIIITAKSEAELLVINVALKAPYIK